jgi:NAD(P)-dependent dehydrogenase (short-subunit alcohol dehydrogenase family)
MERVLVVGATGNIGVAAIKGALRSGRSVLAMVRNQASADKLYKHVGTSKGIQVVEADVTSDTGVKGVVDQVKAGKLPPFQHVYTCGWFHTPAILESGLFADRRFLFYTVGGEYTDVPLKGITLKRLRNNMTRSFEANFCKLPNLFCSFQRNAPILTDHFSYAVAYRDTIEYLQTQNHPNSTWTICTGSQGVEANFALPAMTQGPLYSMATAAARENEKTNVRVNEVYLMFRVEVDEDAAQHGVSSSSEFSSVYEEVLTRQEIRSSRVTVETPEGFKNVKFAKKF